MSTSTPPSDDAAPPRRSIAEIEADIARTREELSRTVDELASRVDPRTKAKEVVDRTKVVAADTVALVQDVAEEKVVAARTLSRDFVADLKDRKPKALAILGGSVAALVGVVTVVVIGRRRT